MRVADARMITKRLLIHGRVQGVYFRESMRRRANELGINGWVRNRSDGTVEAVVQGSSEPVDAIIAWAQRGPDGALVTSLEVTDSEGDFQAFGTLPTL